MPPDEPRSQLELVDPVPPSTIPHFIINRYDASIYKAGAPGADPQRPAAEIVPTARRARRFNSRVKSV